MWHSHTRKGALCLQELFLEKAHGLPMFTRLGQAPVSRTIALFIPAIIVGIAYTLAIRYMIGIATPSLVALGVATGLALTFVLTLSPLMSSAAATAIALGLTVYFDVLGIWMFACVWAVLTLTLARLAALRTREHDQTAGYFDLFFFEFFVYQAILAGTYLTFWHGWMFGLGGFALGLALLIAWATTGRREYEVARATGSKTRRRKK